MLFDFALVLLPLIFTGIAIIQSRTGQTKTQSFKGKPLKIEVKKRQGNKKKHKCNDVNNTAPSLTSERSLGLLGGQPRRLSIRRSGTSHKQGHWLNELQRRLHVHRHTSPPPTFTWLTSGWGPVTCALLRARTPRGLGYTLRREVRGPIPQALPPDELYWPLHCRGATDWKRHSRAPPRPAPLTRTLSWGR